MAAAPAKVLLLEDEEGARVAAGQMLSAGGFHVVPADTIESGWKLFLEHKPRLAILDIELPDGSGVDFCRKIREHQELKDTPVIMLTAKSGLESKKGGFEAGADQYLVKPVDPQELLLWVKALLRRLALEHGESDVLRAGDLELDAKAHMVKWQGTPLPRFTVKEFDLLYFLVEKRPKVMSREQILKQVWDTITVDHVVDAHLHKMRKKLPPVLSDRIQNIPGKGFRYIE
ncbi:MAG: response regulator transcription factor [Elusimicrobia bacterium]|nr:response regulator transcription factor [Elusimicrobiota bacterium]